MGTKNLRSSLHILFKAILKKQNYSLVCELLNYDMLPKGTSAPRILKSIINLHKQYKDDLTIDDIRGVIKTNSIEVTQFLHEMEHAGEASTSGIIHIARSLNHASKLQSLTKHVVTVPDIGMINWEQDVVPELRSITNYSNEDVTILCSKEVTDNQDIEGVETGFTGIDDQIDYAFTKGSVHLFAGAKGSGKTMLLTNLAWNMVKAGYKVLYTPAEDSVPQIKKIIVCIACQISFSDLEENPKLYYKKFERAKKRYGGEIYFLDMETKGPAYLENCLDSFYQEHKELDVLIFDYLGLLRSYDPSRGNNLASHHGQKILDAKDIAKRFNLALLSGWQLSISAMQQKRRWSKGEAPLIDYEDFASSKTDVPSHIASGYGIISDKQAGTLRLNLISHKLHRDASVIVHFEVDRDTGKLWELV